VGTNAQVVVKRIKPALFKAPEFPIFREMFLNEAKLVRSLQHPNLARVHALLEAVDQSLGMKVPFIVGEYIRGQQLWQLMRIATHGFTGRGIPPAIAAYIGREIARGLGHAHANRDPSSGRPLPIIHRDISPENIMVSDEGQIKVIDFGVAKAVGGFGPQTQTGIIKGKLAYMAPEQVAQQVVPATDVFGAAIVLHEMLTGRRLFAANNEYLVVNKVLKAEIPRPSDSTRGIPKELEQVLMTALSRDLTVRYTNGNAFADALTEVMKHVTFLRGMTSNGIKRWMEQTLAEGARIADQWQADTSDDNLEPAGTASSSDAEAVPTEKEIELSGADLIFGGISSQVDPAVKAAVTQGLRTLKPDMLAKQRLEAGSASGSGPLPGAIAGKNSAVSGRRSPPPPPASVSGVRSLAQEGRAPNPAASSDPVLAAVPSGKVAVDPNASTPDLLASTDKRLHPIPPGLASDSGAPAPHSMGIPAALHALLSDPQTLRWLSAVAGLGALVLLLLLVLLFRC
jgi:serine/threonine-protein kinase